MSKSRTAPDYLTKREISDLDNDGLVSAFEIAVTDLVVAQNHRARVPQKVVAQLEWMRDELILRLRNTEEG